MPIVYVIIISVIIYLFYQAIHSRVSKAFELKDTDIDTDLSEFRESHAVATVIKSGALNLKESITQRYERMCILDPVPYKDDPSIPQLIQDYQDIIQGRVLDTEGVNIPSEELLGQKNPDYRRYVSNQARAMKKSSLDDASKVLNKERSRVDRLQKEKSARNQFYAYLVDSGVPLILAMAAVNDTKLNTYTAEDWKAFSRAVKNYIEISNRWVVQDFVSLFDDKDIILDLDKFENFTVFYDHMLPKPILIEIVKERITSKQATQIIDLVQSCGYDWEEAMKEVISEDLKKSEESDLRKKYGWKG